MATFTWSDPSSATFKRMEFVENLFKLTAAGWDTSPDPPELFQVLRQIKEFADTEAPQEVFQMCDKLLYNNPNTKVNDCGLNLLLHLVRERWGDLSGQDIQTVFRDVPRVIASASKTSALSSKSKTAMLVSYLIEKEGIMAWEKIVQASIAYLKCDDIMANKTILTCLSQVITIPDDDDSKDKRINAMKMQNWDWLPEMLFPLFLKHLKEPDPTKVASQQHYDLALYIANTISAYAEWAEVKNLVKEIDWIKSCNEMLAHPGLFPAAFAYLSQICLRAQPADCDDDVLLYIFDIIFAQLTNVSLAAAFRRTVCLSIISIKKTLGPSFEQIREDVTSSLEKMKADVSITDMEYEQLRHGLV